MLWPVRSIIFTLMRVCARLKWVIGQVICVLNSLSQENLKKHLTALWSCMNGPLAGKVSPLLKLDVRILFCLYRGLVYW